MSQTFESYQEERRRKIESRLAEEAMEKMGLAKKEKDKDRHWTDKLHRSWPGAVGSAWG